jgi:hypothetical protein
VTIIACKSVLAIVALAAAQATALAATTPCCQPCGPSPCSSAALCKVPLTKSYRVENGYCAQQLVGMIAQCVPAECADCCGPYGIPPIYVAGNFVLVRQTPEVHERVAKFLTDLGAYVPPKPAS